MREKRFFYIKNKSSYTQRLSRAYLALARLSCLKDTYVGYADLFYFSVRVSSSLLAKWSQVTSDHRRHVALRHFPSSGQLHTHDIISHDLLPAIHQHHTLQYIVQKKFWHQGTLTLRADRQCPDVKNYKWPLYNPVWHRMLYSCTFRPMATVDVRGTVKRLSGTRSTTKSNQLLFSQFQKLNFKDWVSEWAVFYVPSNTV